MSVFLTNTDQTLLQEIKDLLLFSTPKKLRQSLQQVLFGYLAQLGDDGLNQRAIEDFQYLIELLDRLESTSERD